MSRSSDPVGKSPSAQGRDSARQVHEALMNVMHRFEAALAAAAPGREAVWRDRVAQELKAFHDALAAHIASTESPAGLFGDVESINPSFHHRIERLKHEHADLLRQTQSLETHLVSPAAGDHFNFHDVRQRASWLLTALRHHQALEADLVFELYELDIGGGD